MQIHSTPASVPQPDPAAHLSFHLTQIRALATKVIADRDWLLGPQTEDLRSILNSAQAMEKSLEGLRDWRVESADGAVQE
jgi:hypothetical protein